MRKKRSADSNNNVKEILVNVGPVEKRIAFVENGKLVDFTMERKGLEHYVGNIYKGKVSSIVRGIEAAFVEIGLEKNGFLHVSDVIDKESVLKEILPEGDETAVSAPKRSSTPRIDEVLKNGQEIVAQVVKEAIGTKGARITTFVSIPGRYLVLTPYDSHIGISRRIRDREKRRKMRDILKKFKIPDGIGCIVRTVAEDITEKEIREEMNYLLNLWKKIKSRVESQSPPVVVYEEYGAVLRTVRDGLTDDIERLTVDSKDEYARILKFLKAFRPGLKNKVKLHKGKTPLFQKHELDKQIDAIFERKVLLKSGG